jgi:7,8-dihydropterin-6-yl-methyl-4-(beta-D-ribofuranosyl)aminobenzene 5'-phosphate synthase
MTTGTGVAKITIVVDNRADPGLLYEHGFSPRIEVASQRLLFDTGQGPAFAGNIEKLGGDLRTADTVVLSHGHYDHTGGLPQIIKHAPAVEIYAHPAVTGPRYPGEHLAACARIERGT